MGLGAWLVVRGQIGRKAAESKVDVGHSLTRWSTCWSHRNFYYRGNGWLQQGRAVCGGGGQMFLPLTPTAEADLTGPLVDISGQARTHSNTGYVLNTWCDIELINQVLTLNFPIC